MSHLEDETSDVIAKAMMGNGIGADELAAGSGVEPRQIQKILGGFADPDTLRKIASPLGLDPEALVGLAGYEPQKIDIGGVRRLILPFGQWTVNAWLIRHEGVRILFDTGCSPGDIRDALGEAKPDVVFITHSHPDHVGGNSLFESGGTRLISETKAMDAREFRFGNLQITAVDLSGHKSPAAGYVIKGQRHTLLVAGDAIFAGSIGRCRSIQSYALAMANLRHVLGALDPDCVILPGHGPASTVAGEFRGNPFHPGFR